MLDLKQIRENPEIFRTAFKNRGGKFLPNLEELLTVEAERREKTQEAEALRTHQNRISKKIGELKKAGQVVPAELAKEAAELKQKFDSGNGMVKELDAKTEFLLLRLPNIPDTSVPLGGGPQDNKVVAQWAPEGKPLELPFSAKDHKDLGESLGILDFEKAVALSGSRFALLKGKGAALERALVSFMLDLHINEHSYQEIFPPFIVTEKTLQSSGQLPFLEEDAYRLDRGDGYLIPTAEVALTNLHREEIIEEASLPKAYVSYSACFRREAGSFGKDTRGLIRNHQFNKVELVRFCAPEKSSDELELLRKHAEEVLKRLEIPYHVLLLCTGDMGIWSAKTYDLEVWMPGEKKWREISSISNCTDFQARRCQTKVKRQDGKKEFLHTLNASGLAIGRTFAAILENCQKSDGHVVVPQALRKYLNFQEI